MLAVRSMLEEVSTILKTDGLLRPRYLHGMAGVRRNDTGHCSDAAKRLIVKGAGASHDTWHWRDTGRALVLLNPATITIQNVETDAHFQPPQIPKKSQAQNVETDAHFQPPQIPMESQAQNALTDGHFLKDAATDTTPHWFWTPRRMHRFAPLDGSFATVNTVELRWNGSNACCCSCLRKNGSERDQRLPRVQNILGDSRQLQSPWNSQTTIFHRRHVRKLLRTLMLRPMDPVAPASILGCTIWRVQPLRHHSTTNQPQLVPQILPRSGWPQKSSESQCFTTRQLGLSSLTCLLWLGASSQQGGGPSR